MNNQIDMTGFFEVMAEAVRPFRSAHNIGGHNIDGCRVIKGKRDGQKSGMFQFSFLAKGDNEVIIEIDVARLIKNPKEYCDQLMDSLNEIFKRVRLDQRLIVAVSAPVAESPSGVLH